MRISKIECPDDRAEGTILASEFRAFPYNTELVSSQGVCFHVWLGEYKPTKELLDSLRRRACNQRDVVYMTYSDGKPTGFWAHEDF